MKRSIFIITIIVLSIPAVLAQGDDYKKGEFYVGYSGGQIDRGFDSSVPASGFFFDRELDNDPYHGANVSAVYNISRYIGLKADFSAAYNRTAFNVTAPGPGGTTFAFDTRNSLYNGLGGIQIKNNSAAKRFKPFVHALVGVGHGRTKVKSVTCPIGADCSGLVGGSETGLAGAFGGGLDIKLGNHVDLRLVQIDYQPDQISGRNPEEYSARDRNRVQVVFPERGRPARTRREAAQRLHSRGYRGGILPPLPTRPYIIY